MTNNIYASQTNGTNKKKKRYAFKSPHILSQICTIRNLINDWIRVTQNADINLFSL